MANQDSKSDGPASRRVALYSICDAQLQRLRRHAEEQGWEVHGEYCDRGGSKTALAYLFKSLGRGGFDAVVFVSLQSLGKEAGRILVALDRLRQAGIDFVSLQEGIDSDGPAGWTVLELVKATAKLERSRMRPTGRPKVQVDMARLQDMHSRGLSLRQMARLLKVSKSTVERLLKHPPSTIGCFRSCL